MGWWLVHIPPNTRKKSRSMKGFVHGNGENRGKHLCLKTNLKCIQNKNINTFWHQTKTVGGYTKFRFPIECTKRYVSF